MDNLNSHVAGDDGEGSASEESPFQAMSNGEPCYPVMDGYRMKCCDCGLVHNTKFRALKVGERFPGGAWAFEELPPEDYRVELTAWRGDTGEGPLASRDALGNLYIRGVGTVQPCLDCDVLVVGGPTRCMHCAGYATFWRDGYEGREIDATVRGNALAAWTSGRATRASALPPPVGGVQDSQQDILSQIAGPAAFARSADSASSIDGQRQEAGPHEKDPVPASSPVAPQTEPVAFDVRFLAARVRRVMRAAGIPTTEIDKDDEFVASVAGTLLGQVASRLENAAAAPQGDGLLRQAMEAIEYLIRDVYDPNSNAALRVRPVIAALRAALPSATKD